MHDTESARKLLQAADVFFGVYSPSDDPKWAQTLNLNDAFAWGCAEAEYVEDSELPRVAELFWRWGWCGILYWVEREKRPGGKIQFEDVRRWVNFVGQEEMLRRQEPSSSKRAFMKHSYTLGGE